MKIIPIVRVPHSAFNPHRPASTLLRSHVLHLKEAEQRLPQAQRTGVAIESIHTEGEAAAYIEKVTRVLHPESASREVHLATTAGKLPRARRRRATGRVKQVAKRPTKRPHRARLKLRPRGRKRLAKR
jgi:hypothetical protein